MTHRLKRELTNCIDTTKPTNIGTILNTNGYYEAVFMDSVMYNIKYDTHFKWDTVRVYKIFYSNGLVVPDIWPIISHRDRLPKNRRNIENYLKQITNRTPAKNDDYYDNVWGMSKVKNDTLIVQSMHNAISQMQWNMGEVYFKVINENTIKYLGGHFLGGNYPMRWVPEEEQHIYKFVPFDEVPTSKYCWLLKQKWAYCK